jgi:hypothetical protein
MSVWATQMGWDGVTYMIKEVWPDPRKKLAKKQELIEAVFWAAYLGVC